MGFAPARSSGDSSPGLSFDPSSPSRGPRNAATGDDPQTPTERELATGSHVGRYVVLYRLGRGGMGLVYAAYDPQLDRKVAIKIMRGDKASPSEHRRMLREAQALARLSHPNVVAVHDVGTLGSRIFVAMDFVEGKTLRRWLQAEPRSSSEILDAFVQAGEGLAAAHAARLVHRDFKPDNAIVGRDGRVQVLDFGLARTRRDSSMHAIAFQPDGEGAPHPRARRESAASLAPRGTPAYMAPEQHKGEPTGPATDQFAFCVALYEALFRKLPFVGESLDALAQSVTSGKIAVPPRGRRVPARVRKLILRGLAVAPDDRHPSMRTLLEALTREPAVRRRQALSLGLAGAGAILAASVGVGETLHSAPSCEEPGEVMGNAWSQERRTTVREVFYRSDRAHAVHTATEVVGRLDRYAQRWNELYTEACESTLVAGTRSMELFERQRACLLGARQSLETWTSVLVDADEAVIDHAVSGIDTLVRLDGCTVEHLLSTEAQELADSPELTPELAKARTELTRARALGRAGKLEEARRMVRVLLARAERMGFDGLAAEGHLVSAELLELAGDFEAARDALRSAARIAEIHGHRSALADARIALIRVVGAHLRDPSEAAVWTELADTALQALPESPARTAAYHANLALALVHTHPRDTVLEHQRKAVELARTRPDFPALELAEHEGRLAMTLAEAGSLDEARARVDAAAEIWRRTHGELHPGTIVAEARRAALARFAGDYEQARELYEIASSRLSRVLGPLHPRVLAFDRAAAVALVQSGDPEGAEPGLRRILAELEREFGAHHPLVAQSLHDLGTALVAAQRLPEGLDAHRRALRITEALRGPEALHVAQGSQAVADTLERLGRYEESLDLRVRALHIVRARIGSNRPAIAVPTAKVAVALADVGRVEEARDLSDRAADLVLSGTAEDRSYVELAQAYVDAQVFGTRGLEAPVLEAQALGTRSSRKERRRFVQRRLAALRPNVPRPAPTDHRRLVEKLEACLEGNEPRTPPTTE